MDRWQVVVIQEVLKRREPLSILPYLRSTELGALALYFPFVYFKSDC